FSSRRRHTRSYGDWSSDVCSSDLHGREGLVYEGVSGGDADALVGRVQVETRDLRDRERLGERGEMHRAEIVGEDLEHGSRAHGAGVQDPLAEDRKSTRLNSSHRTISYAVFCLKKKKK